MTPSYVKVTDLRVGLPVEYLGKSNPIPVLDEKLLAIGMVLYSGHPGRIWSTVVQHVQVTWASLEDERPPTRSGSVFPTTTKLTTWASGSSPRTSSAAGDTPFRAASQAGKTCPAGFRRGPAVTHRHDQPDIGRLQVTSVRSGVRPHAAAV